LPRKSDKIKPLSGDHISISRYGFARNIVKAYQNHERAKERAPEVSKLVPIQLLAVGQVIIAAQMKVRYLDEPCNPI
jgi:hypothetical protein